LKPYSAEDLRRLPTAQRDTTLSAAAAIAERDYGNNQELTALEAFGRDDLFGESANSEPRCDLVD
jgi:hypothetical protein